MLDDEGKEKGIKAQKKYGSLAGYVVAREALSAEEISMLKEWFGTDEMEKELEGVEASGGGKNVQDESA
jgi:hypothetical protein